MECTVWCSEIGSLTSLDAPELHASSDVREPISLHQAVVSGSVWSFQHETVVKVNWCLWCALCVCNGSCGRDLTSLCVCLFTAVFATLFQCCLAFRPQKTPLARRPFFIRASDVTPQWPASCRLSSLTSSSRRTSPASIHFSPSTRRQHNSCCPRRQKLVSRRCWWMSTKSAPR